jgi:hypothetical protein
MTGWAGFWIGLALLLAVILGLDFAERHVARIWPLPQPPASTDYTRCPYVGGC